MGNSVSDAELDAAHDVTATADQQNACSAEPLTFYEGVDADAWAGAVVTAAGDAIRPAARNGYCYECTTPGTTGGVEPVWPTTPGQTVNDNGVVWTCRNNYVLASAGMAGGDYVKADGDTSGRKLTMSEKAGVIIHTSGTANHVALVTKASNALRRVVTCQSKALTANDTVTISAWKAEIADPA